MIRRRRGHRCSVDFAQVGNKVSHIYSTLHPVLNMAESYHRGLSKPHRKFGVCRSRRLAIRGFGNGEVPFLVTLAVRLYLLRKSAYRDF